MTLTKKATDELSLVDAARRLLRSREQTMRLIYRRDLEASMRAGRWVVTAASVERFLLAHEGEAA